MIKQHDKEKLLSLKRDLPKVDHRQVAKDKCSSIQTNTEWVTERNGKTRAVWVTEVKCGKVVVKEDLNRADSQTLSVEKFLKFFKQKSQ